MEIKDAPDTLYERCDKQCPSRHCDADSTESCVDWHTEAEHFEGTGEVYFECDEGTVLENGIDDLEDEIDRMAELMALGRI